MRVIKDMVLLDGFMDTNGRKYDQKDVMSQISGKKLYGELGSNPSMEVDLSRVSHIVEDARIVDGSLVADIHVLDTPMGKIVESLMDAGVSIRTSIRAIGIIETDNTITDLRLVTFDIMDAA